MTNVEHSILEEMASKMETLSKMDKEEVKNEDRYMHAIMRHGVQAVINSLSMIIKYSYTSENINFGYFFNAIRRYAEVYNMTLKDAIRYADDEKVKTFELEELIADHIGGMFVDEDGEFDQRKLEAYISEMDMPA